MRKTKNEIQWLKTFKKLSYKFPTVVEVHDDEEIISYEMPW